MAWTATLASIQQDGAEWKCQIAFTSRGKRILKTYFSPSPTDAWILEMAKDEIARLNTADQSTPTLNVGTVLNPLIPPPETPTPAPIDQDRVDWRTKYHKYLAAKRGVENGMLDSSVLPPLLQAARAAFKPEYGNEL